jgi:hypothetical protein
MTITGNPGNLPSDTGRIVRLLTAVLRLVQIGYYLARGFWHGC